MFEFSDTENYSSERDIVPPINKHANLRRMCNKPTKATHP